jgi:tight adherence protein B
MAASILVAVFAGGAVLSFFLVLGSRDSPVDEVSKRLSQYGGEDSTPRIVRPSSGNPIRDLFTSMSNALNPVLARTSYTGHLAEDLQKADLRLKTSEWILGQVVLAVAIGLLLTWRFGNVLWIVSGIPVSLFGSGFYVRFRQARRRHAFERQLSETITLLSNALKAGYSFAQAMSTVSHSAGPPIGDEFNRATREIALGISVDDALNHMVDRNRSEDFDLLVTAVQIQRVVGGNLAEILDTIAFTIRERVRIQGEIRTLTAQARFSGIIIFILPIALAIVLSIISPDYFSPMFKQPLGWIMLSVGLFAMIVGYGLIQKIVRIEV